MFFRELIAFYCEHHTKFEYIQSAKYSVFNVKAGVTCGCHCDVKSYAEDTYKCIRPISSIIHITIGSGTKWKEK
jgi:hypothetical protein